MEYKVKGAHGDHPVVHFRCAQCHSGLKALLAEAGAKMECPSCQVPVQVPGMRARAEWKRDRAAANRARASTPPEPETPAPSGVGHAPHSPPVTPQGEGAYAPAPVACDTSGPRVINEAMIGFASSYIALIGRCASIAVVVLWAIAIVFAIGSVISGSMEDYQGAGLVIGSAMALMVLWIIIRVYCGVFAAVCEMGLMANRKLQGKL